MSQGGEIDPKYETKPAGPTYRMPKTGNINDGIRIDEDSKKWDLSRQDDGSVLVNGKKIRLKVFADKYLDAVGIYQSVESVNPKWDYDVANSVGYWADPKIPQWKNVEITSYITFLQSPRDDPFVGYVVRSCIHDLKDDKELEGRVEACRAGSAYHSNIYGDGHTEEKIEFQHADYGDAKKIVTIKPSKFDNLIKDQKKIGFKMCLYNLPNGKVKSETYFDLSGGKEEVPGTFTKYWETTYDGSEGEEKNLKTGSGAITWGSPYIILKSNDSSYKLHDLEIREIIPPT